MLDRHIWEGWTVRDFINDLSPVLQMIQSGQSHTAPLESYEELKKWCMDNQPYYKKFIPEVVDYFAELYNLKSTKQ